MISNNKKVRATFLTLMTIALLVHSGCNPVANNETTSSDSATSEPTTDPVASTAVTKAPVAEHKPVVIDGDLGSVDWRSMLGKQITVTGELLVVDTYDLVRRGQVKVARDRLFIPTSRIDPNDTDADATSFEGGSNVAKVTSAQKYNDAATIMLDDGSADENIFPPTLFPNLGKTHPTVRVGSVLNGVSGKLVRERNTIVLVPAEPLQWTPARRPQRPDVGETDVTVASFNVLNYFTTIDNGANNARGADSESELKRQEAKLVSAIIALQADVIGLMELENNLDAENRLVAALNREVGKEVFKGCSLPDGFRDTPGGRDAIRVGIIYRTDRVAPVGEVAMIRDDAFEAARTPIVQSFQVKQQWQAIHRDRQPLQIKGRLGQSRCGQQKQR